MGRAPAPAAPLADPDARELALADLDDEALAAAEAQVPVAHLLTVHAHAALLDHARRLVGARHEVGGLEDLGERSLAQHLLGHVLGQLAAAKTRLEISLGL